MEKQTIIVSAVILAVLLAGFVWYQATRQPETEIVSPPEEEQLFPTPTPWPTAQPPLAEQPDQPIDLEDEQVMAAVAPTAETGPADWYVPGFIVLMLAGGGLFFWHFRQFSLN